MNITTFTNNVLSARLFAGITMLSLLMSAFPVAFFVAQAQEQTQVTYCHWNEGQGGRYQEQTSNENSMNAHMNHQNNKDIIPAFGNFPGLNLEDGGQAFLDAGCTLNGSISGAKYDDSDNDGSIDGEDTIESWTIRLYEVGDPWTLVDSTNTDQAGEYEFTGLPEGSYKVCEVMQTDWVQTFVSNGTTNESPNVAEEGAECRTVNINDLNETNTVNFGNYLNETIDVVYGCMDEAALNYDPAATEQGEVRCEYPEEPVSQCIDSDQNLLDNGSFETPVVNNNDNWIYTLIPDWMITALNGGAPQDGELHNDWNNNQAADGDQYAELDSRESVKMAQTAAVLEGGLYELSWAFAPRHDINADENQLSVQVDGVEVATEGPASLPAGISASDWTRNSTTFTATSDSVEIAFADNGATSDKLGTFLDDTRLCLVEEPESEPEEPEICSEAGEVVSYTQGNKNNGSPVDANRSDVAGAENGVAGYNNFFGKEPSWSTDDFYTLGINGELVYMFTDKVAVDQPGDDIAIWEITGGNSGQSNEKVDVYLSQDGINFELAEQITGDGGVDIADTTLSFVKFVKLVDQSNGVQGGNGDGYDLDAITIIDGSCDDPEPIVTLHTTKIVCEDESELPNGDVAKPITASTAQDWVDSTKTCALVDGWEFEWADQGTTDPGDTLVGSAGSDWTTFTGSTVVPLSAVNSKSFWVREVLQEGYIPFTHGPEGNKNTDNVTAEMYCHTDVKNYDNFDRVDNPKEDGNYYCVAWNTPKEIPAQYADVTMCKEDEQGNQLSGWQLALLGDTVDTLAFAPTADTQSMTSVPAGDYVVKADGTYGYGNGGRSADARFSERKPGDEGFATSPFTPWREALEPNQGLAVQVEGDSALWGSMYSPAHVYYGSFTQASEQDIDFSMYDNQYADNSGSIDLTLYQGFTGITGKNGCVVFEDVPYGDYEVEELLQGGFENTSGLGSVTVDEDEETFTVVNNDLSFVPACELDIYSDEMTLVKETNQTAKATYDGNTNWTANIANAIWVWVTDEVTDPENDETYTFVETFTVTNPSAANLTIAHDNWLKLTINDTVIERDQNGYRDFQKYDEDILAALVSGENRIEMEVTNIGTDGSNYLGNPAGALFHIDVTGEGESCERTTEPASSSLTIDTPAIDGEILSGTSTFAATYKDFDNDEDEVFWAIRAGSCNGTDMAGNAPASPEPNNPSTFNPVTGAFETTVDMSTWDNGDYCLVVNPKEDGAPAPNERETRTFVLANQSNPNPEPETETISGYKYNDTNGNGVLDDGELGEAGWTITAVEIEGASATQTAITNEAGFYSFDLPAGQWSITEAEQDDWIQTAIVQNGFAVNTQEMGAQCSFNLLDDGNFYFALVSDDQPEYELTEGYTCDFYNQPTDTPEPEIETRSSSRSSGTRIRQAAPTPLVLGESTASFCPFLVDHMQMGWENDQMEVMKLQLFLNIFKDMFGGTENPVTGTFGATTDANVKAFQDHFRSEILDPWYDQGIVPHNRPTGFVYKTTLWKINDIVCDAVFPSLEGESLDENVDIDVTPIKD